MECSNVISITAPIKGTEKLLKRIEDLRCALRLAEDEVAKIEDQCVSEYLKSSDYLDLANGAVIHNSSNSALYISMNEDIVRVKSIIADGL